jgi:hypothetical protein
MANEQNLINGAATQFGSGEEAAKNGKKGGINSGKARRRKADLRRMAQDVLDGTYTDKNTGEQITGEELVLNGIVANLDPNSKNWGKAMDLLVELLGADKSREEKQQIKAQTALLKAKVDVLTGADTSALDRLDAILEGMKNNAERSTDTESETE